MGHQTQFEKDGELSTAKGVYNQNILGFFSTQGRTGFQDLKKNLPKAKLVFFLTHFKKSQS